MLLTACSANEAAETDPTADTTSERPVGETTDETSAGPPADDTTERTGSAEGAAVIETADSDLGTILVDDAGMTLYLLTQDSRGKSVCVAECLEEWQVLEGEPTAGDGVDSSLLGSIERDDGTVQATRAGGDGAGRSGLRRDQE